MCWFPVVVGVCVCGVGARMPARTGVRAPGREGGRSCADVWEFDGRCFVVNVLCVCVCVCDVCRIVPCDCLRSAVHRFDVRRNVPLHVLVVSQSQLHC